VASYEVNERAVANARRLIDSYQYVLDSAWSKSQPAADDLDGDVRVSSADAIDERVDLHVQSRVSDGAEDDAHPLFGVGLELADLLAAQQAGFSHGFQFAVQRAGRDACYPLQFANVKLFVRAEQEPGQQFSPVRAEHELDGLFWHVGGVCSQYRCDCSDIENGGKGASDNVCV